MASGTKNKKWFGYALYVVLVTIILLYYLFPAQPVEELLNNSVSRISPEFSFKAEKIRRTMRKKRLFPLFVRDVQDL